jgi:acetyl esterase/lipase
VIVERYGDQPRQFGQWWLPERSAAGPLVVLIHGGYWRDSYDLTLEDAVAADLAHRGFLVWNIDYAPSTQAWPATLSDAAAAYDFAFRGQYAALVDPTRVAVAGHSAGGHLALWLASRSRLPAGAPGAGSHVVPRLAVPQAPVAALSRGYELGLGSGAVAALLGGGPSDVPDRYALADPVALAPSGVPTTIVHGVGDDVVPISQSEDYVAACPGTALVRVPGGHFTHLDPSSEACAALRRALAVL